MWPKALAQLLELLPHLSRLIPIADRFLQSKSADQEANTRAMQAMAEGLRGDLGQVTASHAGLYRQLNDLDNKTSEVASEVNAVKVSLDAAVARLAALEWQIRALRLLLTIATIAIATALILIIWLLFRR